MKEGYVTFIHCKYRYSNKFRRVDSLNLNMFTLLNRNANTLYPQGRVFAVMLSNDVKVFKGG